VLSKKGEDVVILDVRGLSTVTDYYLLATANGAPHIKAIAAEIERELEKENARCYRTAGSPNSGWVVADYFDAVIHIFTPKTREYYALERLWGDAKRVELDSPP
jgi:ribosome-associated protein